MPTLKVKNLKVTIDGKEILKGLDLEIPQGKVHAIMGPNGSGKSTLANALAAHPKYQITDGTIHFGAKKISGLPADKIARAGILMAFQYPQSISGVSVANLLKISAYKTASTRQPLAEFSKNLKAKARSLHIPEEFLSRSLNEGFSGGEKKKAEILQLAMLSPKLVILDETDSGLDVDALKLVAREVNKLKEKDVSVLLITHYQRILRYVQPDFVHVLYKGKIIKSGDRGLAEEIEKRGYGKIINPNSKKTTQ